MERSRNFYKTIRLGYILISVLIGCIAYNSFYEWQEIEALELDNKKIDEFRKEINNINKKERSKKVTSLLFIILYLLLFSRKSFVHHAHGITPGMPFPCRLAVP